MSERKNPLVEVALAYQNGEIDGAQLEWILADQEKRDHITSVYVTEVSPQKIATILINDWTPVQDRYGLEYGDVPAWRVRECINFYADETIAKKGMITLFEHFAEAAVKQKKFMDDHTVEELAAMVMEQHAD